MPDYINQFAFSTVVKTATSGTQSPLVASETWVTSLSLQDSRQAEELTWRLL